MKHPIIDAYVKAESYQGFDHFGYDVNEVLRSIPWENIDPLKQQAISTLDSLFKDSCSSPLTLYRAASMGTLTPFISQDVLNYPAFMSTSRSLGAAAVFLNRIEQGQEAVLMKIIYPANCPYIDAVGINNEQEVLLPRNKTFAVGEWAPDEEEQMHIGLMYSGNAKLLMALPFPKPLKI